MKEQEITATSKVKFALNETDFENGNFEHGVVIENRGSIMKIESSIDSRMKIVKSKFCILFDPMKLPKTLEVNDKLETANSHLPVPLVPKEKVIVLGWHEDSNQFIKVRHNRGKTISVFGKWHFKF